MNTAIILCLIVAAVVFAVIYVFRDRLSVLTFDGSKAKMEAKMEARVSDTEDEKSTDVVFRGNKFRGKGKITGHHGTKFIDNDLDGDQEIVMGDNEPPDKN